MVDKSVNQNPFEFGIFQRVRRWFGREPIKITIDIEPDQIDVEKILEQLTECKPPAFRNGLTRIGTKVPPPPPEYRPKPAMPPPPPKQNTTWIEINKQKEDEYFASLRDMLEAVNMANKNYDAPRSALIAVIEQWGPLTFAAETIEANKKKKISIEHVDGFVKFRIEGQQQEWPDESRIDIIGSNGGDGAHYAES